MESLSLFKMTDTGILLVPDLTRFLTILNSLISDRSEVVGTTPLSYVSLRINPSYDEDKPTLMQFDDIQNFIMNVSILLKHHIFMKLNFLDSCKKKNAS